MAVFAKQNSFPWGGWHQIPSFASCSEDPAVILLPSHRIGNIVLYIRDRRFHAFCVYAPTAVDNHKAECRTFYDELSSLVIDIPLRDHILISGDLNARLTAEGCRVKNVCGKPNSNSEALLAFIDLHDIIASKGIMRQKRIKLPTFDEPRGRCTHLDWVFGRNRLRQCLRKVMNIKTTVLTSDHRLLLVNYRLRWPSSKKRMASEINWSYIVLPSSRTDLVTSTRQFQEKGIDFFTSLSSAAQISLPKSIAPTRVRSWNNNVELRKARSQVHRAHHKFRKYSSQHSAASEGLDCTNAFVAETHAMAIIDDIESQIYERRTAAAWKSINEICGRKSTPLGCIKTSSIDQVEVRKG